VRRKGEGCGWAKQSFGPRKTPSPITQNKGGAKVNMNSSLKKPFVTLEYNKGKEKFLEPSKKPPIHVYLHYSKESNGQ
jgi:hypothetical protein